MFKKEGFIFAVLMFMVCFVMLAPSSAKELKIGYSMPLTGGGAPWGLAISKDMQAYADVVNTEGGIKVGDERYQIKLIPADNKYTAEGGRSAAEKLLYADKVDYIMGPWGGSPIAAMSPIINREKKLFLTGTMSSGLYRKSVEWPYNFYCSFPGESSIGTILVAKKQFPKLLKLGQLHPDDESGHIYPKCIDLQKEKIVGSGLEVGPVLFYPRGTKDFHPYLAKLHSAGIDILWGCPAPGELGLIMKQAHESGYGFFIAQVGTLLELDQFVSMAGGWDAVQNFLYNRSAPWEVKEGVPPKYIEITNKIRKKYKELYGKELTYPGSFIHGLNEMAILFEALEGAGTTNVDAVKNWLETQKVPCFWGKERLIGKEAWGRASLWNVPYFVGQIQGHNEVYLGKYEYHFK